MSKANSTSSEPKTIYDKVASIIRERPEAARNYNLLLALYWCLNDDLKLTPRQIAQIAKASKAESVSRVYRFVREDNVEELRKGVQEWVRKRL